jgi:hypothetical protein
MKYDEPAVHKVAWVAGTTATLSTKPERFVNRETFSVMSALTR